MYVFFHCEKYEAFRIFHAMEYIHEYPAMDVFIYNVQDFTNAGTHTTIELIYIFKQYRICAVNKLGNYQYRK